MKFKSDEIRCAIRIVGIIALALILLAGGAWAVPYEKWSKTFGGKADDRASYVSQTKDGGYIISGFTELFEVGAGDAWLIKTDVNGVEQWNRTFGGIHGDKASFVQQTKGGGYIIAGTTESFGIGGSDAWPTCLLSSRLGACSDAWIVKTDANGIEKWNRTFGGNGSDEGSDILRTKDGGYIITGTTDSFSSVSLDAWLIKTDSNGLEQWSKVFGGIMYDTANSVQLTRDGGYIFAGSRTDSYGDGYVNAWLVKVNEGARDMEKNIPFPERSSPAYSPDIAKNIALKNLDKEILNRTPEVVNTSWITDNSALVILTFKDPDSPAHTIVAVDLNKNEIDSVEKISWNFNFPLYFNITSNPSGADVYLTKYSPELCGPEPHKPGFDLIGKTPLTYKFEYNETFLPLSGLFSLFYFSSSGYEEESECINIYGSESSEISVSMVQKGYFDPVPRTNQTYYLAAKLKPVEKIKVENIKKRGGI